MPKVKPALPFVPPSKGTPSTINNGVELPVIVPTALMVIFVPLPEIPLVLIILTPAALPVKTRAISPSGLSSRSFLFTVDTE